MPFVKRAIGLGYQEGHSRCEALTRCAPGVVLQVRTLYGHGDKVTSVGFSACGSFIVSGSSDSSVKIWDVASGAEVSLLGGR